MLSSHLTNVTRVATLYFNHPTYPFAVVIGLANWEEIHETPRFRPIACRRNDNGAPARCCADDYQNLSSCVAYGGRSLSNKQPKHCNAFFGTGRARLQAWAKPAIHAIRSRHAT